RQSSKLIISLSDVEYSRIRPQAAWHKEICHRAPARAVAYLQPHVHGLWADSRVLHVAQGYDELGGLPGGRTRMQCANGLNLRRGTTDLPAHRSAGRRIARAKTD